MVEVSVRRCCTLILWLLLAQVPLADAGQRIDGLRKDLSKKVAQGQSLPVTGTRFGIKLNRPAREYPGAVLKDLERFRADRLSTVMLSLPWSQWARPDGSLNPDFVNGPLAKVLKYSSEQNIPVVVSVHCSFWGEKGNWSIPKGVRSLPDFASSASVLTEPSIRQLYVRFLEELIAATAHWDAVIAYNILNEPVAATRGWVTLRQQSFSQRWEGVQAIVEGLRIELKKSSGVGDQLLIVGTANGDPDFGEHVWKRTGGLDLASFWDAMGVVAGQYPDILEVADQWHANMPKMRTEGFLSFAAYSAWKAGRPYRWEKGENGAAMYYDYDAVYAYEGMRNLDIKGLVVAYVWRIGSPDGSKKHLWLFDHRNNDQPTPYYYALRDLASGVDSFETFRSDVLPKDKKETLEFAPGKAARGISTRWHGSGKIIAHGEPEPGSENSTMSARVVLEPGQFVERDVLSSHWVANGVSQNDSFVLQVKSTKPYKLTLFVRLAGKLNESEILFSGAGWEERRVSFEDMGLAGQDLSQVTSVGLKNNTGQGVEFLIDDFLIR